MFKHVRLNCGIPVLMEQVSGVRSASAGIYLKSGSRQDPIPYCGLTHFMEHMFFKGSAAKPAPELAREMDLLGGQFDAGTSKEMISVQAKVVDRDLKAAWKLLRDLVINAEFSSNDIESEKGVVLEEINMSLDDPEDYLHELTYAVCWPNNPLSRPILGIPTNVVQFDHHILSNFHSQSLSASNIVLATAGNFEFFEIEESLSELFDSSRVTNERSHLKAPDFTPFIHLESKSLEQVYFNLTIPWFPVMHKDRYTGHLINLILGGNMSSLLFQMVREQRGLAYNIASFEAQYMDAGMLFISGSTSLEKFPLTLETTIECIQRMANNLISEVEFENAKECLKRNIILSFEGSTRRMNAIARQHIYFNTRFELDDIFSEINNVKFSHFIEVARKMFLHDDYALCAIGNFRESFNFDKPFSLAAIIEFI